MQPTCRERTSKIISTVTVLKQIELEQCSKKIEILEEQLHKNYSQVKLYKYRQANKRLNALKAAITNLKVLELRLNKKS